MLFFDWLLLQRSRTDAVGRLAVLASSDPQFPRTGRLSQLLRFIDARPDMRASVRDAHREWRRSRESAA